MKSVADEAAKVKGIEKVIYVENGAYEKVSAGNVAHVPLLIVDPGTARELRTAARREHQEGSLYACLGRALSIRQEPTSPRCCALGCASHLRHHRN